MVSESSPSMDRVADVVAERPVNGSVPSKNNRGKVPKKIHKAEREKLKRDHLNDLFLELGNALDPARQNNGKATILCDTTRLLRDLMTLVGSLKKENDALLTESHYLTVEKNELQDDKSALQDDISRLQRELQERMQHDPPTLSEPDCSTLPLQNSSVAPVFVLPLSQDLQQTLTDAPPKPPSSHISKPHARYPTPESWPLEFLTR